MGFCLINNVVVAARHAQERGKPRVLIVDWDVHHGNGTQALVERDPSIRYVSMHQYPWYPGTGAADERGVGNVFNVPRPPGLAREVYARDLLAAVDAALVGWRPDLLLVSAGFDSLAGDPLGGFTLEPADAAHWTEAFRARVAPAPVVGVLEGGYRLDLLQHALLEKVFEFHPLAVEDTLSPRTRVKLEEYDRYVFVVMAGVQFDQATPDPFDLQTSNLYFFLGKNFLVTVHAVPSMGCDAARDRLLRSPDLLARGAEMTMHHIIDQAVDSYFPLVEELNGKVDGLERKLFEEFDEGLIHEIFKAKRSTFGLRRHIGPLREVLNILTNRPCGYIRPETQLYYRDIYDHTIRLMESVDTTRDLLAGVLETYLSQTSNRMNRVMKQLSIVATVALPLIVIAGIYGMNFSRMPLVHDPLGFWVAVASMVIVSLLIVWWLNRRKWL